jgi:adenylylsulfate kinase
MKTKNIIRPQSLITRNDRQKLNGHCSALLWFTGLSGSGKSTLAHEVEYQLHTAGYRTYVLDGDNVRHGLCHDLGFSAIDRSENIRRISEVANLFLEAGVIVLAAFISPFSVDRELAKQLNSGDFLEIYCHCPLSVCENRDVKGLYKRARAGEIENFTGISSNYEIPKNANLILDTSELSIQESTGEIINLLIEKKIITSLKNPKSVRN